ncbi:hypothetical protein [Streptomyces sp. NRRL S-920]|uniref:hypothetical protein n=1 Tax=Streptomyces sp. NRRL S-920 TaxID=1463921 RepID=UPI0004C7DBB6|nr:hypothetical protein [Streptomyces sp. NRRL S-920]
MLASVDVRWLWLMAAAATVLHSSAMALWVPLRKFRLTYPWVWVVTGVVYLGLVGWAEGIAPGGLLVLYSFALTGLTIGLFPSRKLLTTYAREIDAGVARDTFGMPRRHVVFCVAVVIVMSMASFALTRA